MQWWDCMQTTSARLLACSWFQRSFLKTDGTAVFDVPFPLGRCPAPDGLAPESPCFCADGGNHKAGTVEAAASGCLCPVSLIADTLMMRDALSALHLGVTVSAVIGSLAAQFSSDFFEPDTPVHQAQQ